MTAVRLDGAGHQRRRHVVAPRRVHLSRSAIDRLADLGGVPSPAAEMATSSASLDGLGERLATAGTPGGACRDVDGPLEDAGLVEAGIPGEVGRAVLAVWGSPTLAVEIEMLLRLPRGTICVLSRHRSVADWVVCLSTGDGEDFELAWLPVDAWRHELARAARVDADRSTAAIPADTLPGVVDTPWDLLLATGEAVQRRRPDLLDQLVSDHTGTTRAGDSPDDLAPGRHSDVRRWLEQLESTSRGRLHAAVVGRSGSGRPGAGIVEWVLLADGWRSLTPFTRDGWAMVRVQRVAPPDLPRALAARAAAVTS